MATTDGTTASDTQSMFERVVSKEPVDRPEPVTQQPEPEKTTQEQPRDQQGRFTKAEQEAADRAAADKAAATTTEQQPEQRGIPPGRLREEADARRKTEAELADYRKVTQDELAALRREMQLLRQPTQRQEAPKPPDLIEDPEGYRNYLRQEAWLERRRERIDETFEDVRETNPQGFEAAWNAIQAGPQSVKETIINAPNPGKALMRWHNEQAALKEIGSDFQGYRTKLEQQAYEKAIADPEFRKRAMAAWRDEATNGANTRQGNVTDLPSLNRTTGTGNVADDLGGRDDKAVFQNMFARKK